VATRLHNAHAEIRPICEQTARADRSLQGVEAAVKIIRDELTSIVAFGDRSTSDDFITAIWKTS